MQNPKCLDKAVIFLRNQVNLSRKLSSNYHIEFNNFFEILHKLPTYQCYQKSVQDLFHFA